mmetsp:Transcript_14866/g.16816  ORF Transcript_14866/g.16816 Transcript_14866/m.16816 type:complete len:161 (-) Transcript_14866:214-696(-)
MVSKRSTKKKEDLVSALSETIWNQTQAEKFLFELVKDCELETREGYKKAIKAVSDVASRQVRLAKRLSYEVEREANRFSIGRMLGLASPRKLLSDEKVSQYEDLPNMWMKCAKSVAARLRAEGNEDNARHIEDIVRARVTTFPRGAIMMDRKRRLETFLS